MAEKIKKYRVEYGKCSVHYTAESLESVAREYGFYDIREYDYLTIAVVHFCAKHFMWAGNAHRKFVDAETRGCLTQNWIYQPNGVFRGWINAVAE